jgi:hypothetical protein
MQRLRRVIPLRVGSTTSTRAISLVEDLPRFVSQAGLAALRFQRFPEHVGQEADQDMSLHPLLLLVPHRANLQI